MDRETKREETERERRQLRKHADHDQSGVPEVDEASDLAGLSTTLTEEISLVADNGGGVSQVAWSTW